MTAEALARALEQADTLIAQHIDADPGPAGDERASVRGYGIPVWSLVATYRRTAQALAAGQAAEPVEAVAHAYGLPPSAVVAALAYALRYRDVINRRIARNRAD